MPSKNTLSLVGAILVMVLGFLTTAAPAFAASHEKVLHRFNGKDGAGPSGLVSDAAGNLYGTTGYGGANSGCQSGGTCGTAFELVLNARGGRTEKVLHNFGKGNDGWLPSGSLILDSAGNLYGTTEYGGTGPCLNDSGAEGCGTVFKLTPRKDGAWKETVIYNFGSQSQFDGVYPVGGVVLDGSGNLYGSTSDGGANDPGSCDGFYGCGTVFRLAPGTDDTWSETTLYNFCSLSDCADGEIPWAGVVLDAHGNLFGTTLGGGSMGGDCGSFGCGTVFRVRGSEKNPWTESVLWVFGGLAKGDGKFPEGGVLVDAVGSLYGTTYGGGSIDNLGAIFQLSRRRDGEWIEKVLHRFNGYDGEGPDAGLIFDSSGNFYGTTYGGGSDCSSHSGQCGVVFKFTPGANGQWAESVLHNFCSKGGACPDGSGPVAGVIIDGKGNLHGTTTQGGLSGCSQIGCGVVFEIAP